MDVNFISGRLEFFNWKDETDPFLFKEKNPEFLWDVISALAQSDTEGFELEEYQLREFLQKLRSSESDGGLR